MCALISGYVRSSIILVGKSSFWLRKFQCNFRECKFPFGGSEMVLWCKTGLNYLWGQFWWTMDSLRAVFRGLGQWESMNLLIYNLIWKMNQQCEWNNYFSSCVHFSWPTLLNSKHFPWHSNHRVPVHINLNVFNFLYGED